MKKLGLLGTSALSSAAIVGMSFGFAAPAAAQAPASTATTSQRDCPAGTAPTGTAPSGTAGQRDNCLSGEVEVKSGTNANAPESTADSIVVTGSRIRRPNLESTVPISSVAGEEFFQTGKVSVGDVLNELPQLRSTFGQSNSTRFLGTAGLNLLDLRGLGTQRTLVLVNGRRHVGGDILNNAVSVDVNTIPTDLIERVDVVTGGNSAIYGSDAIAGVVNFVMKEHFDGVQLRGQGGVSKYSDAGAYFVSLLAGRNFAGGRGNIAINAEYARQNQYFGENRPNLAENDAFLVVDTDPAGVAPGQTLPNYDGNPDRVFFRDIRSATIARTGLIAIRQDKAANPACGTDPIGTRYACNFIFLPTGELVPQTGARVAIGPNGSFIGGNGDSRRDQQQLQLIPQLDRYNVNLLGHFDVSSAFQPFFEAKYARTDSVGTGNSGPAFFTGSTIDAFYERPRLDNPFLDPAARQTIASAILASGTNPNSSSGAALSASQIAQINAGSFRFPLRLNLLGLGLRTEQARRETYRGVLGFRGDLGGNWRYEASATYGETRERTKILGNLNVQRFVLAMDAVRNAQGQIVCGSQVDPNRANVSFGGDIGGNPSILAADIAACVPINPFGGQFTQAQRNYLLSDTEEHGKITQFVANAFISGDTGSFFNLPGGPVGIAAGAEYRRETLYYKEDPLVEQGYTFYNAIPTFTAPAFEVKEAFGELRLPILKDVPFFQELTLSGAGRVANYRGKTGTVFAYNAGVDWAPIRDLRFRANYSRAVRAPNLSDLYSPPGQNFAPGFGDPCSLVNIGTGSATREANCRAAGIPSNYDFRYSQSLAIVSGGNPNLKAETSRSITVGGVFQPRMVPGLSLSVDYYDITVNNVITAPTAQNIANACYDAPTLNNQFCPLFQRSGPNATDPFRIVEGSLQQLLLNYARLRVRGIDVEAAYRHRVEGVGTFNARLNYTHALQRDSFLDPAFPNKADQQLMELGDPQDRFTFNLDLKTGPFTFGYRARYISKMVLNEYEDFFSKQGRPPQNADYADRRFYPSVLYHNARIGIDAGERFNFYMGVDNITNRMPPLGLTGIGGGSGIYDNRGRFYYAGAVAKF